MTVIIYRDYSQSNKQKNGGNRKEIIDSFEETIDSI